MRYLSTYFYHDSTDLGATYGNIDLPLSDRNEVYWKTIFTFFSTSIPFCSEKVQLVLFTNEANFPYRNKIEALGVLIFDDLVLTHRNNGRWATVKFFFDVLFYIDKKDFFLDRDSFIMVDTDVVCLNDFKHIFNQIENSDKPIAYSLNEKNFENPFHGSTLEKLTAIASELDKHAQPIVDLIGGEFFGFTKNHLKNEINDFRKLLNYDSSKALSTEEEILTIKNSIVKYRIINYHIYRIWTTLHLIDIPKDWAKYSFLHLPSEKESGLLRLFNRLSIVSKSELNKYLITHEINKCFSFNKKWMVYLNIVANKLRKFFLKIKKNYIYGK